MLSIGVSALAVSCMSVDSDVTKTPSRYWKAPKEAMPEKEVVPEQIKTSEIIEKSKILPASDKMAAGNVLTLADIVDITLENNTTTRQYWYQAKVYAAQKGMQNAQYMPTISVGAQVYRAKNRMTGYGTTPPVGSFWESGYGPTLQINWMLYDFGKREANVDVALENLRAANFDYNQSIQDVVLNVSVAYFNLFEAMGAIKASLADLQDARTAYKSAKAKMDQGVGNRQDMLLALANAKNAEFALEKNRAYEEQCRAALASAMGIRVDSSLKISDDIKVPDTVDSEKKIETLIAEALSERQNVLSAYASMRAAKRSSDAAFDDYFPTISAVGTGQWTDYFSSPYTGAPSYGFSGGIALSWDLFDGFVRQYEIISANAKERAAAMKLKETQINIISDVWTYFYAYKSALKQVESARAAVEASRQACNAVKIGYESGINSLVDLLTAQANLATARQQSVSANAYLAQSIVRLAHSTGKMLINTPPDE